MLLGKKNKILEFVQTQLENVTLVYQKLQNENEEQSNTIVIKSSTIKEMEIQYQKM